MKRNALASAYALLCAKAGPVVLSLVLLLMRIIWGWQFFIAGRGKLLHIQNAIGFFKELGIPAPAANAWLVSIVEVVGGLLLLVGLASRPVAIVLTINMIVAYLTAHRVENLKPLFAEGDFAKFAAATPFWFLVTSVLVLALGPGCYSIDGLLKRTVFKDGPEPFRRGFPIA